MHNINKEQLIQLFKSTNSISYVKLSKLTGISKSVLQDKAIKFGINKEEFKLDHNFFSSIKDEATAYWLGFLMADGYINKTSSSKAFLHLHLGGKDKNHIQKFLTTLDCKNKIYTYTPNNTCYCRIYSNKLCNDLEKIGCYQNKSLTLKFPPITSNLYPHLIRGYIDGDGCICYRKNRNSKNLAINIIGTEQFLTKTQNIFKQKLSIPPKKMQNCGKNKSLTIGGQLQSVKILNWLYQDATIYLERKYDICKKFLNKLDS